MFYFSLNHVQSVIHYFSFPPLQDVLLWEPPRTWDRCFNTTANWCSQCTLLLAAAVWIHGVVQNLLWPRDIARLVPLSTCLTHSSAECSLPCQGRDWSSRNDKEKRTSGRTSWKDAGASRREHDETGGNQCKCAVFVLGSGESES